MIKGKKITLVVPCKNEADSLGEMLERVPKCVDEVIVVDNKSTDKTAVVAKKHGVKVVREGRSDKYGIGYGYAHMRGLKEATGDIVVAMDGDGTYPLGQVGEVVKYLVEDGLDFVACSRFPLQRGEAMTGFRQLGVWILNTEVKLLYLYPMQDILSGMWAMNRKAMKQLKLTQGGWDLSPEIKLEALTNEKIRVGQYLIDHYRRDNGASKQQLWTTGFNHMKYILVRRLTTDNLVWTVMAHWVKAVRTSLLTRWLALVR